MIFNPAQRMVLLLALCQALAMTGNVVLFTVAALIGQALATDKSLATLPLAMLQIATMSSAIPASLLMQRVGRQVGFMVGVVLGLLGAGLGILAVQQGSFNLFCLSAILFGSFNSFMGFYRFAAAEVAEEGFRSKAIALVLAGGVVAAIAGPQLANWSKDWLQSAPFAGSLSTVALLQLATLAVLPLIHLPRLTKQERQAKGRPLRIVLLQPVFIVAVLGSMLGYGVMILIMTATPLAMVAHHHPFHEAASVMQWHVLGMFAPSFFTGALIARFGILPMVGVGSLLSLICIGINVSSQGLLSYAIALFLLGIGWNFMFIGSTTLLTEAYTLAERAKTQAAHDFLMFGFVAFATMLSGSLFQNLGWQTVNYAGIPMMVVVLGATLWLGQKRLHREEPELLP